jgi:hypothetical protein
MHRHEDDAMKHRTVVRLLATVSAASFLRDTADHA